LLLGMLLPGPGFAWQAELQPEEVVPELVALGLRQIVVEKHYHRRLSKLLDHEDRYFLVIRLGRLTKKQFDRVRALYGGYPGIAYERDREYRLKDFMPPVVQALLNKTFRPVKYDLSFLESSSYQRKIKRLRKKSPDKRDSRLIEGLLWNGLSTETNCWNASVEVLNAIKAGSTTYRVFTPARWEIDFELKHAGQGRRVREEADIEPWDLLLISTKSPYTGQVILQHTALLLNRNLVFEKVDSPAEYPYRLSMKRDVLKKYRRALVETFRSEYRRYPEGVTLFRNAGIEDKPWPKLTAKIFGEMQPPVPQRKISVGCDSGKEDSCILTFQVVEKLTVVTGPDGGKLRGKGKLLRRFQSLEGF
jgi:hypothetical protein